MARNKHSTALFDVIHSAKKPPKGSPSASIPTPKWWGKDKKLPKPAAVESTENAGRQRSWLSAAKKSVVLSTTPPPAADAALTTSEQVIEPFYTEQAVAEVESPPLDTAAEIEITSISPPEPKVRFIDRFKNRPVKTAPVDQIVEEVIAPPPVSVVEEQNWIDAPELEVKPEREPAPRESAIKLDPAAHEIKFNLSYGGLAAIIFFLIIALAFAFVIGTRSSSQAFLNGDSDMGAAPATSPTGGMMAALEPTQSPETMPVHPEVLQVAPRSTKPIVQPPATTPPATALPIKATRDIGMIYVVIQSYPEQELAQHACDFMNKSGIPCSLVQGPDGWAPRDWYSVVGLQPFTKHDPGLDAYERLVKAAGGRFTTKILDQFQPQAYTWRETSDLSQQ